jgi:hypothetical protein
MQMDLYVLLEFKIEAGWNGGCYQYQMDFQ